VFGTNFISVVNLSSSQRSSLYILEKEKVITNSFGAFVRFVDISSSSTIV